MYISCSDRHFILGMFWVANNACFTRKIDAGTCMYKFIFMNWGFLCKNPVYKKFMRTCMPAVTVLIISQYQLSIAMHYWISGVLIFALRVPHVPVLVWENKLNWTVVGLRTVLIACKKILNDAVTVSDVKIN